MRSCAVLSGTFVARLLAANSSTQPDLRRPERVFWREGSPNIGTMPLQEILRAKRRAQDDVDRVMAKM
ncbi:hypothetical protein Lsha_0682 [Legionella shakespearei DSM 23087]|uniref:Uncharacterized protein n=1 Tax=Legionella shakespearei DSM 23087 TaxID=1122169 RepID=A0A0W0Z2Z6_9GAMM|nr:hypothetical protein Lsha_0682 [Legionella shakespearei DSM 23087]